MKFLYTFVCIKTLNRMLKIGITGCIGSGKSTVVEIFAQLGIPVYNADFRAKFLMEKSPTVIAKIKNLFGDHAYKADGILNRKFIADKVFSDTALLTQLNEIVHPAVFTDFEEWCNTFTDKKYVVKEAALMFESISHTQLDKIIVVTAPEVLRINRTIKRDHVSSEDVIKRMKNQFTQEKKLSLADYEIKNDENELLIPQVLELHHKFSV